MGFSFHPQLNGPTRRLILNRFNETDGRWVCVGTRLNGDCDTKDGLLPFWETGHGNDKSTTVEEEEEQRMKSWSRGSGRGQNPPLCILPSEYLGF